MITIIGNPENRRVHFFQKAVEEKGQKCYVLSYEDILQKPFLLEEVLSKTRFLKIESCGENFQVYQQLVALGIGQKDFLLKEEIGRIHSLPFGPRAGPGTTHGRPPAVHSLRRPPGAPANLGRRD